MSNLLNIKDAKIAVIGLGYVGLPLAVEFGKHFDTLGFDINSIRIDELNGGQDATLEISTEELAGSRRFSCTANAADLKDCNIYIVTVPTPIDNAKRPDLNALLSASRVVGGVLSSGNIVIYESTVYPGATEDDCAPILEDVSGLAVNRDFFLGYSPERINPGDKEHRVTDIRKVVSGSTEEATDLVDALYKTAIRAGTYRASSIKVAEAAKVIENTQRDVNIALINELALIFNRLGLDTLEVLEAAGTKWNFLPFRPGLVGGHCIGVDPYYLTHKSQEIGYHPAMILAGRRINDNMGLHVASEVVRLMIKRGINLPKSKILILGMTFKENCPDVRNTRVIDVIRELQDFGAQVDVYDPWVDAGTVREEYDLSVFTDCPQAGGYDGIVLAVAHREFLAMSPESIHALGNAQHILYDIKSVLPAGQVDARL